MRIRWLSALLPIALDLAGIPTFVSVAAHAFFSLAKMLSDDIASSWVLRSSLRRG